MQPPLFAEDLEFQRKTWIVERVGWALLAAILVGAAAGLFGPGFFARVSAPAAEGGFTLEYLRFARMHSPVELRVRLEPSAAPGDRIRILISTEYLDRFSINGVVPEPERAELGADGIAFVFTGSTAGSGGSVRFLLEADRPGPARGTVAVNAGAPLQVRQYFYP